MTAADVLNAVLGLQPSAPRARVYLMWDADDTCLYVGVTSNFDARLSNHRWGSPWLRHVVRTELAPWMPRLEAERLERATILAHRPVFNRRGNPDHFELGSVHRNRAAEYLADRETAGAA